MRVWEGTLWSSETFQRACRQEESQTERMARLSPRSSPQPSPGRRLRLLDVGARTWAQGAWKHELYKKLPAAMAACLFLCGVCFLASKSFTTTVDGGTSIHLPHFRVLMDARSTRQQQPTNVFATIYDLEVTPHMLVCLRLHGLGEG
jgi:hypothetical protein